MSYLKERQSFLPAILLCALTTIAVRAQDPVAPDAGFPLASDFDHLLIYEDGYNTLVDVYMPAGAPPASGWPVLVLGHGFGGWRLQFRGSPDPYSGEAARHARRGYFVIAYDVRGQGTLSATPPNAGKGSSFYGPRERRDMKLLIEDTLARYPTLADPARLGVVGSSQGGALAWMAAAWSGQICDADDPLFGNFPTIRGVVAEGWNTNLAETCAPDQAMADLPQSLAFQFPIVEPAYRAQYNSWLDNEDYAAIHADRASPNKSIQAHVAGITTAVLHMQAFDDGYFSTLGPIAAFQAMPASTPKRLYLGTPGHSSPNNDEERAVRDQMNYAWVDRWVKGIPNGSGEGMMATWGVEPYSIPTYLYGIAELWVRRAAESFPPASVIPTEFHLDSGGGMSLTPPWAPDGARTLVQNQTAPYSAQQARLAHYSVSTLLARFPLVELTYLSAPLSSPMEIAGSFTLNVTCTPLTPHWQVNAVLGAEGGGETWRPISAGFSGGRNSAPGTPVTRTITGHAAAVVIPAGARLSLRLRSSSVWDDYTPSTLRLHATPVFGDFQVQIGHGSLTPLTLTIPVLPSPVSAAVLDATRSDSGGSAAVPHSWSLTLRGGAEGLGQTGIILVGFSGTSPGFQIGPHHIPLNLDELALFTFVNPEFGIWSGFDGPLDASAHRTAVVNLDPLLSAALEGVRFTAVGLLWNGAYISATTNPVGLAFVP